MIVNEVLALERRGLDLVVFSLVRSGETVIQPQVGEVRTEVRFLEGPRPVRQRLREHLAVIAAESSTSKATSLPAWSTTLATTSCTSIPASSTTPASTPAPSAA